MHRALTLPLAVINAHTGEPDTATHEAFLILNAGWEQHTLSLVRVVGKVNGLGEFVLIHVPAEETVVNLDCNHAELNTIRDEIARIIALAD